MRALSLLQPWATLIAIGAKRCETRSWYTPYRGPLAIHASKTFPAEGKDICAHVRVATVLQRARLHARIDRATGAFVHDLPLGAVLAVCRLADCVETAVIRGTLGDDELAFGNYTTGRFAWLLEDIRPLPEPIPAKGALGLWTWDPPAGLVLP